MQAQAYFVPVADFNGFQRQDLFPTAQTLQSTQIPATLPPIPGCALWLDAADSATVITSGFNVTQWNDKSGNGYNVISNANYSGTTLPTYSSNTSNKYVQLLPTQALVTSNAWNYSPSWSCFVAINSVSLGVRWLVSPHNGTTPVLMGMSEGTSKIWNTGFVTAPADITGQHIEYTSAENTGANSNLLWYRDGTLQASNVKTLGSGSGTMYMGIGANGSITNAMAGTYQIYEILIYNSYLSTTERQQVEGYLARKWGLNLPVAHPYYSSLYFSPTVPSFLITIANITATINQSFLPTSLSGLSLWLDAADASTVGLSGANVTQWRDKSGNGRNGTANGTVLYANRVIGGLNTISFTAVTNSYIRGNISITGTTFTCFAVATLSDSSKNDSRILSLGVVGSNDYSSASYAAAIVRTGGTNTFYTFRNLSGTSSLSVTYNVPFLICALYDGTNKSLFINSVGTSNASVGTFNISNYQIGSSFTEEATLNYGGFIGEEIVFSNALTTTQRQQVEGYLAWKWGLQTQLPSGHPNRYMPP